MAYKIKTPKSKLSAYEENLTPEYDSRKSFYGKAVVRDEDGKKILRSYNTDVACIENGKPVVYGLYSDTTTRHIKEFLKQNGFKAENGKQILADYGEKSEGSKFGTLNSSGEVKDTMIIDLKKVKSPDALAYSYGYFQGKSGKAISKDKDLAPEYVRGYQDGKAGKKL